jgi:hypothetical protein
MQDGSILVAGSFTKLDAVAYRSIGRIQMNDAPPAPNPPRITGIERAADGSATLSFQYVGERQVRLQRSRDLEQWDALELLPELKSFKLPFSSEDYFFFRLIVE